MFVGWLVCLFCLLGCLFYCLLGCLFVCLFVCLFICLFLSVYLFVLFISLIVFGVFLPFYGQTEPFDPGIYCFLFFPICMYFGGEVDIIKITLVRKQCRKITVITVSLTSCRVSEKILYLDNLTFRSVCSGRLQEKTISSIWPTTYQIDGCSSPHFFFKTTIMVHFIRETKQVCDRKS